MSDQMLRRLKADAAKGDSFAGEVAERIERLEKLRGVVLRLVPETSESHAAISVGTLKSLQQLAESRV